jgi:hypothetical protein
MDAILFIIGIAYEVCGIVIESVQQCTYFLCSVNLLLVGVNYEQRTMQVCSEIFLPSYKILNILKINSLFKEALATILTKKIICFEKLVRSHAYGESEVKIICLQGNNKSMVIFVLKRRKVVR